MKKFMVMLLMMVMATFASPLFALDESPPGVEKIHSTNAGETISHQNSLSLVGAAHADNAGLVKVDILHKDSLMYSIRKVDSNKAMKISDCKQNTNMNIANATVAVVCYHRGMVGA